MSVVVSGSHVTHSNSVETELVQRAAALSSWPAALDTCEPPAHSVNDPLLSDHDRFDWTDASIQPGLQSFPDGAGLHPFGEKLSEDGRQLNRIRESRYLKFHGPLATPWPDNQAMLASRIWRVERRCFLECNGADPENAGFDFEFLCTREITVRIDLW